MLDVTKGNFEQEVLLSKEPVVIDFWAEWCGPCRMVGPIFQELAKEMEGKVKFVKIDVDSNPDLASMYNVQALPSFLIFKAGEVAKTIVGANSKDKMKEAIESLL